MLILFFPFRPGHGLIEVIVEYEAKEKKVLLDYAETLEKLLQDNNIDLPTKSDRVQTIENHLTHHGEGGHE